jgi:hypothetical protein
MKTLDLNLCRITDMAEAIDPKCKRAMVGFA